MHTLHMEPPDLLRPLRWAQGTHILPPIAMGSRKIRKIKCSSTMARRPESNSAFGLVIKCHTHEKIALETFILFQPTNVHTYTQNTHIHTARTHARTLCIHCLRYRLNSASKYSSLTNIALFVFFLLFTSLPLHTGMILITNNNTNSITECLHLVCTC